MTTTIFARFKEHRTALLLLLIVLVLIDLAFRATTSPSSPPVPPVVGIALPEEVDLLKAKPCRSAEECQGDLEKLGFTKVDQIALSLSVDTYQKPSNSVYCVYVTQVAGQTYVLPEPPVYYPKRSKCPTGMKKVPG
jgi:hypothetical protein